MYGHWRTDKPKEKGFSHEIISPDFQYIKDQTTEDELICLPEPGVDTILKAFRSLEKRIPDHDFFGTRVGDEYQWMTVSEVASEARLFASGMQAKDLTPIVNAEGKDMRFCGIQSKNRKEWSIVHIANMHVGATTIALYDTLGVDQTKFIIDQTGLTTMTCSFEYVKKLSQIKSNEEKEVSDPSKRKMKSLVNIVSYEAVTDAESLAAAKAAGITVYSYAEILKAGSQNTLKIVEPARDDIFMLSYTSGTTGDPKGVKLNHLMVVTAVAASQFRNGTKPFDENDCYISYLPAAHSFEQCIFGMAMISGMKVGFFGGDIMKMISHDIPCLKPTFFPSVPRLYNRIYGKI